MARNAENAQAKDKSGSQQSTSRTNTSNQEQSKMNAAQSGSSRGGADQQRAIQTNRDADRSTSPSSHEQSPQIRSIQANPFWLMRRMAEDMDHMLQNFGFGGGRYGSLADRSIVSPSLKRSLWSPQVETFRRGDTLVVRADLPGLDKEDVKVEIEDGVLSISGERSDEHEDSRDGFFRSERSYGQFYRAVPLPEGVKGDQCEATFKNGVLEVTLAVPKERERKAKRIEVG